ncbi:alpha/beta hydrolase [Aurantimonas litoralis]|nr:alpha/beta hydrolase [Aurantimonas litoralis]
MQQDPLDHAAAMLAGRRQQDPDAVIAAVEAAGTRTETPCGAGTMAWRVFGDGPPLALLHGGHGSWLHWLLAIPALARHHRLLVPDLPGFGESAGLDDSPAAGTAAAEAVAAPVLAGLNRICGERPVALAGFSFGGVIAATMAAQLGPSATALVIVGAPGLGLLPTGPLATRSVRNHPTEASLMAAHRDNLAAMMIHDAALIDDLAVRIQALNVPRARTPSRLVSRSTALGDALARIACPLTAIYGEHDVVSPQHGERLAILRDMLPSASQIVLPGVGHWAPYEAPEAVTTLIARASSPG